MKHCSFVLILSVVLFTGACRSEVDDAPPAQVSETSATTETSATSATDTSAAVAQPTPGVPTAKVIKEKSSIEWVGAKVTRDHKGKFRDFDGWIEFSAGQPSRIAFNIDLNSIESDDEKLTGHLKSPDFFDVAKYPQATFVSTAITPAATGAPAGTTHTLRGNLSLHGVTKEVNFPVTARVTPQGVRATSEFSINRHDWGISYKGAADDLIRDNVLIKLDLHFPPPPTA